MAFRSIQSPICYHNARHDIPKIRQIERVCALLANVYDDVRTPYTPSTLQESSEMQATTTESSCVLYVWLFISLFSMTLCVGGVPRTFSSLHFDFVFLLSSIVQSVCLNKLCILREIRKV